jgi:hypothetical protein
VPGERVGRVPPGLNCTGCLAPHRPPPTLAPPHLHGVAAPQIQHLHAAAAAAAIGAVISRAAEQRAAGQQLLQRAVQQAVLQVIGVQQLLVGLQQGGEGQAPRQVGR